jgi:Cu/Ag efflux protein CusF
LILCPISNSFYIFEPMKTKALVQIALLCAAPWLAAAQAQTAADPHSSHHTAASNGSVTLPKVAAEVRRVDAQTGKITLKHADISNLDMPAMTMVFQTASPDMLKDLEVGQKVLFTADKIKGAYTVLSIERAP